MLLFSSSSSSSASCQASLALGPHRHRPQLAFQFLNHTSTLPGKPSTFNVHGLIWSRVAPFEEVSVGQPGRQQSCLKMLLLATPTQRAILWTPSGGWSETLVFPLRYNDPSVMCLEGSLTDLFFLSVPDPRVYQSLFPMPRSMDEIESKKSPSPLFYIKITCFFFSRHRLPLELTLVEPTDKKLRLAPQV